MRFSITILLFIILLTCPPLTAHAFEALRFNEKINTTTEAAIDSFLNQKFETRIKEYSLAATDLNNDDINEYILKRKYCEIKKLPTCNHIILAKTSDKFRVIGNIRARKITISTETTKNIRNILAFSDELNDYIFNIYMWSPKKNMYILKTEQYKG